MEHCQCPVADSLACSTSSGFCDPVRLRACCVPSCERRASFNPVLLLLLLPLLGPRGGVLHLHAAVDKHLAPLAVLVRVAHLLVRACALPERDIKLFEKLVVLARGGVRVVQLKDCVQPRGEAGQADVKVL